MAQNCIFGNGFIFLTSGCPPLAPNSQTKGLVGNRGGGCTEQPMLREQMGGWSETWHHHGICLVPEEIEP